MAVFKGAGVAIVTPFKEDGDIDFESFASMIEYQIANHTDAIIVCGTTGEASTLSHEEHLECIQFVVEKVNKRVPVIAGTGSNCTKTAIYLSTEAEKYGADALLVVSPYYNKATQKGLKEHFTMIANSVKIPVLLYNIPGRTGVNIQPQTIVDLCTNVENIVGVKEACGDISQVAKLMSLANGKVELYSGNDDQIVPLMALGGNGVISVLSNVAPQQTHDIVAKFLEGDVAESCRLQLESIEVFEALFCEVNPIPVKKALNLMGMKAGTLRRPLCEMEPANAERLANAMKKYGILQ